MSSSLTSVPTAYVVRSKRKTAPATTAADADDAADKAGNAVNDTITCCICFQTKRLPYYYTCSAHSVCYHCRTKQWLRAGDDAQVIRCPLCKCPTRRDEGMLMPKDCYLLLFGSEAVGADYERCLYCHEKIANIHTMTRHLQRCSARYTCCSNCEAWVLTNNAGHTTARGCFHHPCDHCQFSFRDRASSELHRAHHDDFRALHALIEDLARTSTLRSITLDTDLDAVAEWVQRLKALKVASTELYLSSQTADCALAGLPSGVHSVVPSAAASPNPPSQDSLAGITLAQPSPFGLPARMLVNAMAVDVRSRSLDTLEATTPFTPSFFSVEYVRRLYIAMTVFDNVDSVPCPSLHTSSAATGEVSLHAVHALDALIREIWSDAKLAQPDNHCHHKRLVSMLPLHHIDFLKHSGLLSVEVAHLHHIINSATSSLSQSERLSDSFRDMFVQLTTEPGSVQTFSLARSGFAQWLEDATQADDNVLLHSYLYIQRHQRDHLPKQLVALIHAYPHYITSRRHLAPREHYRPLIIGLVALWKVGLTLVNATAHRDVDFALVASRMLDLWDGCQPVDNMPDIMWLHAGAYLLYEIVQSGRRDGITENNLIARYFRVSDDPTQDRDDARRRQATDWMLVNAMAWQTPKVLLQLSDHCFSAASRFQTMTQRGVMQQFEHDRGLIALRRTTPTSPYDATGIYSYKQVRNHGFDIPLPFTTDCTCIQRDEMPYDTQCPEHQQSQVSSFDELMDEAARTSAQE